MVSPSRNSRIDRQAGIADASGMVLVPPRGTALLSMLFQVWLPYASYFNRDIAFHEAPDVPAGLSVTACPPKSGTGFADRSRAQLDLPVARRAT